MADEGGGGIGRFGGIAFTIIVIVILNVLSQAFDWGWVFY
jgi:hypothetical protein